MLRVTCSDGGDDDYGDGGDGDDDVCGDAINQRDFRRRLRLRWGL